MSALSASWGRSGNAPCSPCRVAPARRHGRGAAAGGPGRRRPPLAPACDPVRTPPELAGQAPTAEDVLGFPLGEHDVTVAESDAYLQAVAAASPRVTAGTAAVSWQGRP